MLKAWLKLKSLYRGIAIKDNSVLSAKSLMIEGILHNSNKERATTNKNIHKFDIEATNKAVLSANVII